MEFGLPRQPLRGTNSQSIQVEYFASQAIGPLGWHLNHLDSLTSGLNMARNREVFLSSLTIGRCFTFTPRAAEDDDNSLTSGSFRVGKSILTANTVWKIQSITDDAVEAVNVAGEQQTFPPDDLVVELSREGFDRLKSRA